MIDKGLMACVVQQLQVQIRDLEPVVSGMSAVTCLEQTLRNCSSPPFTLSGKWEPRTEVPREHLEGIHRLKQDSAKKEL